MLGEGVVVVGAGGAPLHRPRSADNLSRLTSASSIPALDDLAESEVFVGDEDDEVEGAETYRSLLPSIDPGLPGEVSPPDLLSPPCPPSSTSLVIAYHEDALRLPLDAVKEEVEAEALEEANMILSSGPASLGPSSLGPCSLTSSMVSSASLEDSTLSSRTDTLDTVIAVLTDPSPSPPQPPTSTSPQPRSTSTRPSNKDTARVATTSARTSPTSPRGSSGRSSPRTSTESPSTPEKRRGMTGNSPRGESSSTSSSRVSTPRGTSRMAAARGEDKRTPRGTPRNTAGVADRRPCARSQEARRDTHTHAHTRTKTVEGREEARSSTLGRKKKAEAESRPSPAPTRRKETKPDKETTATMPADKYGSLGRRRRVKEAAGETKESGSVGKEGGSLSRDNKHTLDMYATLPRRRAKEVSARWKEQLAAEEEAARSPLRRTKSVGKSEATASGSGTARSRGSLMTTSLPSSALRPRSPRTHPPAKSTSTSTSNLVPRKERTIICLEAATQTALTSGDVASALRAMSRQNSIGTEESDEIQEVTRTHVAIVREESTPEEVPPTRSVEVQVELAWRLGEGELPEHVRRLTEEHTRLQTEHSRARVRLEELESVKEELKRLRVSLEEERTEKEEVQGELDRTSQRVKDMLVSMEGVEHEFNSRGDSLLELESQLHQSADIHIQMQDRLNRFEECNLKIKKDLDKSVAAQKILLQQVQDLENESREMADFMAEEKNALAECLREAESEVMKVKAECSQLSTKLKEKEEEIRRVSRVAEERRNKYMQLQSDMSSMQCRTRDMMVCQGAEVSGAAVSLTNVSSRLRALIAKLVQDYSITEADLEMIVTPNESDSSASSTNGTPEHKPIIKTATRRTPSPRKTASFMTALLSAMRMGARPRMGDLGGAISSLTNGNSKEVTEGRNSPEGSESHDLVETGSVSNSSLTDQVTEMDVLLTQFLKVCCVLKNESDLQLVDTEDENERLSNQVRSQQQVIEQQHADYEALNRSEARARKELTAVTRDLEAANKNLTKYFEAEYDHQVMKLQNEVEKLGGTVRHLEVLNEEKERQLEEALSRLSAAQESAPANHVSEASHYREVSCLTDKVTSLRQSVMEREKQIIELNDRHAKDLASLREAQGQTQRSATQLHSTMDTVLKTLEGIPEVVSSCPSLKQLFNTLAANEKSTQQLQQNGNINTQNGFSNNTDYNKDLNANPQSIINTTVNNKMLITNQSAETHL